MVVSSLDLNALHGAVLAIGGAKLRILDGCPPCGYLSRLLGVDARLGLQHIGGVRAAIIEGGWLNVGDAVDVIDLPAWPHG